jgi:outer membrane protein assembly factor BamB
MRTLVAAVCALALAAPQSRAQDLHLAVVKSAGAAFNGVILNSRGDMVVPAVIHGVSAWKATLDGESVPVKLTGARVEYGLIFLRLSSPQPVTYTSLADRQAVEGARLALAGMGADGKLHRSPATLVQVHRGISEYSGSYYELQASDPALLPGALLIDSDSGIVYGVLSGIHHADGHAFVLFGADVNVRAAIAGITLGSVKTAGDTGSSPSSGKPVPGDLQRAAIISPTDRPNAKLEHARTDWRTYTGFPACEFTRPTCVDQDLYFGSSHGMVCSVESGTLRPAWETPSDYPVCCPPSVGGGSVCFATGGLNLDAMNDPSMQDVVKSLEHQYGGLVDRYGGIVSVLGNSIGAAHSRRSMVDEGAVVCLDRQSGVVRWQHPARFVSQAIIAGNRVVFGGLQTLGVLALSGGSPVWERPFDRKDASLDYYAIGCADTKRFWVYARPVMLTGATRSNKTVDSLKLKASPRPARVECYDFESKTPLWSTTVDASPDSPALCGLLTLSPDGKTVYCADASDVFAVRASDGTRLWRTHVFSKQCGGSLVSTRGAVYAIGDDHALVSLNPSSGVVNWTFSDAHDSLTAPTELNGRVYVGSLDSNLYAVNARTGKQEWKFPAGTRLCGQPCVMSGQLYCTSDSGQILSMRLP